MNRASLGTKITQTLSLQWILYEIIINCIPLFSHKNKAGICLSIFWESFDTLSTLFYPKEQNECLIELTHMYIFILCRFELVTDSPFIKIVCKEAIKVIEVLLSADYVATSNGGESFMAMRDLDVYELTPGIQKVLINHLFMRMLEEKEDTVLTFLEKGVEKDKQLICVLESFEKAQDALTTYEQSKKFILDDGLDSKISTASQFENTIVMLNSLCVCLEFCTDSIASNSLLDSNGICTTHCLLSLVDYSETMIVSGLDGWTEEIEELWLRYLWHPGWDGW